MSKKVLGKGIGALFTEMAETPDAKENSINDESIIKISINSLKPNPYQPRKEFHEESLKELAESIKLNGILQPILAEDAGNNIYTIITGERRCRAAKLAGLTEVPVILKKFTTEEKIEIALIENIQREDLSPLEEANGYKTMMEILNLNQDEVAQRVGKNRSTVANALRLLKLPEIMKQSLNDGNLFAGHARAILSVINPADQEVIYNKVIKENISVREAEKLANDLNNGVKVTFKESAKTHLPILPELESIKQKFIDRLGTKIEIKGNIRKGKIEISYFSMDDLERILDILG